MLKDKTTEKHLSLLLVKRFQYRCFRPVTVAVNQYQKQLAMLSSRKSSNQISQYILITVVTPVVVLNDYLITADRPAFYLAFIGS